MHQCENAPRGNYAAWLTDLPLLELLNESADFYPSESLDEDGGWYFESDDGIHWSDPVIGYHGPKHYWSEAGRLETPLILRSDSGAPDYLFVNRDTAGLATGFVFKIQ